MIYIICMDPEKCVTLPFYRALRQQNEIPITIIKGTSPTPEQKNNLGELTSGEFGLRLSFMDLMEDALLNKFQTVMMFEEDALLHTDFWFKLNQVLSCKRCSCFLFPGSGCPPGVLYLGMTVWSQGIMAMYTSEYLSNKDNSPCVNILPNSFGNYAAIYNTDTFASINWWLLNQKLYPLDWMHVFLSREGYITRGLYRPIAIANLSHASTVKKRPHEDIVDGAMKRYILHQWNISEFSDTFDSQH